jgi:DNA-binding SARP family transcriptional activator
MFSADLRPSKETMQTALETYHDKIADLNEISAPVAIVFPHNNNRNAITAKYLEHRDAYYIQIPGNIQGNISSHILNMLDEQGLNLKKPKANYDSGYEAGKAIGAAIPARSILIVDQADLLGEVAGEWLQGLAETVNNSARVVIVARRLDHNAINPLLQAGKAVILNENSLAPESILKGETGQLTVHALGIGKVWYDGREVRHWDGPLTRRLFYYLLDRGPVSRTQIFDTFWPSLPIREATNVFHVTKRKMNETIGVDVTDYVDRHYRIADHVRLHYDVHIFEHAMREAEAGFGDESIAGWQRAIKIYRHDFLMTESTPWAVERRNELRENYAQALISMARTYQKYNQSDQALNHYLRALISVPMREDLHLQVMRLQQESGRPADAIAQYELLKQRLHESLRINPGKEATALYQKLLKQV